MVSFIAAHMPAVVSTAVVGGMVAIAVVGGSVGGNQEMIQTASMATPSVCRSASSSVENASDGSVASTVVATDVAKQVAKALSDAKVTRVMAAGVMGNLYGESGMDPTVNENGGGGFGLGQWTPKSKVRAWFDANGLSGVADTDAAGQTRMVVEGTVLSRSGWNNHYRSLASSDITLVNNDLYDTFVAATDIRTATLAYMYGYERPAANALRKDARVNAATGYDTSVLGAYPWASSFSGASSSASGSTGSGDGSTADGSVKSTACATGTNGQVADDARVEAYVQWALSTAADDSHGYSQSRRFGNPDYDCSSFVWYALHDGAKIDGMGNAPFNTGMEHQLLSKYGFENIGKPDVKDLKRGDILLDPAEHTEIYTGNGKSVGAHSDRGHSEAGDQTSTEVSEGYAWTGFTEVWRYTKPQSQAG